MPKLSPPHSEAPQLEAVLTLFDTCDDECGRASFDLLQAEGG